MTQKIITRFSPSPTGYLHLGGVRTALYNYLFARKMAGKFYLRIEDTDQERSEAIYQDSICQGLSWLGLNWDNDQQADKQSLHFDYYKKVAQDLIAHNKAYRCNCSPERIQALREQLQAKGQKFRYDGACRHKSIDPATPHVVRLALPQTADLGFDDAIRGRVNISLSELDDFIILRSDGSPTYNFCCSLDDSRMRISHVIRGEDHISNTPKQILVYQAIGIKKPPEFAHLPMIHGSDGKKLSKRDGAQNIEEYEEQGYLPEALLNFLLRLGFADGDKEIFSLDEMIQAFSLDKLGKSPAIFDTNKLHWLNAQYLKEKSASEIKQLIEKNCKSHIEALEKLGFDVDRLIELYLPRIALLSEFPAILESVLAPQLSEEMQALLEPHLEKLSLLQQHLSQLTDWNQEAIQQLLKQLVKSNAWKFQELGIPLRIALLGCDKSPAINEIMACFPQELVVQRISQQASRIN